MFTGRRLWRRAARLRFLITTMWLLALGRFTYSFVAEHHPRSLGCAPHGNLTPLALTLSAVLCLGTMRCTWQLTACVFDFDCAQTELVAFLGRAPHALPRFTFIAAIYLLVAATQAYFGRRMLKVTSARYESCSCCPPAVWC